VGVVSGRKVRDLVINVCGFVWHGRVVAAVFGIRSLVGAVAVAASRGGGAVARLVLSPMYVSRHDAGWDGRVVSRGDSSVVTELATC
jgi:hypothetical protein